MTEEDEPEIVVSRLGGTYTRDDLTVEVHIYRGADEPDWILEVEDPFGGSTTWDDRFATDEAALAEFRRALKEEGIQTFIVERPRTVH